MGKSYYIDQAETQATELTNLCVQLIEGMQDSMKSLENFRDDAVLQGKTYDSAKSYVMETYYVLAKGFIEVCEEIIRQNKANLQKFRSDVANTSVVEDNVLAQERAVKQRRQQIERINDDLPIHFLDGAVDGLRATENKLREKIENLYNYDSETQSNWDTAEDILSSVTAGLGQISEHGKFDSKSGTFSDTGINFDWQNNINNEWNKLDDEAQFNKNLKEQYGFDDKTISIIDEIVQGLKKHKPSFSKEEQDYLLNRLLGGLVYNSMNWQNTAGIGMNTNKYTLTIEQQLKILGLSEKDYRYLNYMVRLQYQMSSTSGMKIDSSYKKVMENALGRKLSDTEFETMWNRLSKRFTGKTDFAHQSITMSTILNHQVTLSNVYGGKKNVEKLAGWKGDVTTGAEATPNLGNDDYMADLDSVNITAIMNRKKCSYQNAVNEYHKSLRNGGNRAKIFLRNNNYKSVQEEIFMRFQVENMEQLKKIKNGSTAYNFLMNLKNGNNNLKDY